MGDPGAPVRTEQVENLAHRGTGSSRPGPHQPTSTSAQTRVMIEPTMRHATRINAMTVDFDDWVANHATVSSTV